MRGVYNFGIDFFKSLNNSTLLMLLVGFIVFLEVILSCLFPQAALVVHILSLPSFPICLYFWCREHAKENNFVPAPGAKLLTALITIVGIPYYFFMEYDFLTAIKEIIKTFMILFGSLFLGAIAGDLLCFALSKIASLLFV